MTIEIPEDPSRFAYHEEGPEGAPVMFLLAISGEGPEVAEKRKVVLEALETLRASRTPKPCGGCGDA